MPTKLFHRLLRIKTQSGPEVSPKIEIPTPSEWAKEALNFQPDAIQTSVLDHDAHRLILCCSRQWGKTTIIAIKALHTAIFQPGSEIVVISRSLKQAGFLRKRVVGYDQPLHLPNGNKIFGVANPEKSSCGYTGNIVIGSASPTLARTNGKLWLLSTPYGQTGLTATARWSPTGSLF